MKNYPTPMTAAAYEREQVRLDRAFTRAMNRYNMWNDRAFLFSGSAHTAAFIRIMDARDNAYYASRDAGDALAHFERTATVKR